MLPKIFAEERAQSSWNAVYLLLVIAIAAILLIALIKPMFRQSQQIIKQTKIKPK
ncbi:MAG: hypothetical protein J7L14_03950 [Candidatus Diapherotrites archaeon]|nr:hypothetical protein [Candidatus Diapherotrites archaeon]